MKSKMKTVDFLKYLFFIIYTSLYIRGDISPKNFHYLDLISKFPILTEKDNLFSPLPTFPLSFDLDFSLISIGKSTVVFPKFVSASIKKLASLGKVITI